jgi:LacI family transcriptional regulator
MAEMKRPTATDLAKAAGVGISTIDRVLNGRAPVKPSTARQVLAAAEKIGFYAEGTIRARLVEGRPAFHLGFLLLKKDNRFYDNLAHELRAAASAFDAAKITVDIDYLTDLAPEVVAAKIIAVSKRAKVVGVVATQHPVIARAIENLREKGVPTFALLSEVSAQCSVGYIGCDNWKVGRTAGWAISTICRKPGKIAIFVGNHRYRCQELNEIAFRAYLREHAPDFEILEPRSTWEDNNVAEKLTHELLASELDLAGLYVAGGGLGGVVKALRETQRKRDIVTIGYQDTETTRNALTDGILKFVISNPVKAIAREAVFAMSSAVAIGPDNLLPSIAVPMDVLTPENV